MKKFKSGYVAVAGIPNAGKSSLVNALVKEPVSIVTAKPQTTRKRTLGILTKPDEYQIVFVDTPGVIESREGLNPFLKAELSEGIKDVDAIIACIAPWEFEGAEAPWILKTFMNSSSKIFWVATQSDKHGSKQFKNTEQVMERWNQWTTTLDLLITSSRNGQGLLELEDLLLEVIPEGPQYYDPELYTPQTLRDITAEVVRKSCFEMLHQEIPYGLAVVVRTFKEGPLCKIEADILISRESHKGMVIGRGGEMLKNIGVRSRYELEKVFRQKIFLKLHVVVKPWLKDPRLLEELGYATR